MTKASDKTLSLTALNRATLARQMLFAREKATIVQALERTVGLQAQWPKPPYVGLWTRLENFKREDLNKALLKREVVRATMMRCTIHVVSAKDYLAFRPSLQPALTRATNAVLKDRTAELDVKKLIDTARTMLAKEPQTFAKLRTALLKTKLSGDERAMGYVVRTQLPLVQVPTDAMWGFPGNADFALAEQWLDKKIPLTNTDPSALILRYLAAFGPATVSDMQAWSGLANLKESVEALRNKLITFRDPKGKELFDLPKAPRPNEESAVPVRFLPEYDNLIVSRSDERFFKVAHRSKIFLPGLRVCSTFLVDGFVAGLWKTTRLKQKATLELEALTKLSKPVREQLAAEGDKLLRFIEPDASAYDLRFTKG